MLRAPPSCPCLASTADALRGNFWFFFSASFPALLSLFPAFFPALF